MAIDCTYDVSARTDSNTDEKLRLIYNYGLRQVKSMLLSASIADLDEPEYILILVFGKVNSL